MVGEWGCATPLPVSGYRANLLAARDTGRKRRTQREEREPSGWTHPACDASGITGPSDHTDERGDDVEEGADTGAEEVLRRAERPNHARARASVSVLEVQSWDSHSRPSSPLGSACPGPS